MALPDAARSPELCCAAGRPEAAPSVSKEATTKATITVAPRTLRRRQGRPNLPLVLIDYRSSPSLQGEAWSTLLAQPPDSSKEVKDLPVADEPSKRLVAAVLMA